MRDNRKSLYIILIILFSILLNACGSAAKDASDEGVSPEVFSTDPLSNAESVGVAIIVSAIFKRDMDASTINSNTFTLSDGTNAIPGSVDYDAAARTATFTPSSLKYTTTYFATLSTGVKDTTGTSISSQFTWQFDTQKIARFVYVANRTSDTVSAYTMNIEDGTLRHNGYVSGLDNPASIVITPSGKFAYVSNAVGNTVSAFSIDTVSGELTEVESPYAVGVRPFIATIHPSGKFLYVPNSTVNTDTDSSISAFVITDTGALTPVAGSPFLTNTFYPSIVSIDPAGELLFATDFQGNFLSVFSINVTTGSLTELTTSPFITGQQSLGVTVSPAGNFVYVTNFADSSVSIFSIDRSAADATLIEIAGSPVSVGIGTSPYEITIDADGKYAYIANYGDNTVAAYKVNQNTGLLEQVQGSPYNTGVRPATVRMDPSGKFLYIGHLGGDNFVLVYGINGATGQLTEVDRIRTQESPFTLAFSEGTVPAVYVPKFVYTVNETSSELSKLSISDKTTGALTPIQTTTATITNPTSIAVTLNSRLAYTVGNGQIDEFTVDKLSGDLAAVAGSPLTTGIDPFEVTVEPSGRFVYVANNGSGTLSAFSKPLSNSVLSVIPGSPYSAGSIANGTTSVVTDPTGRFVYAANFTDDGILGFNIDSLSGSLTSISPNGAFLAQLAGIHTLAVHPTGKFLYTSRLTIPHFITGYFISNADGTLTAINSVDNGVGSEPRGIAIDPLGKYLYTANYSNSTGNTISGYAINQKSGFLSALPNSPYIAGSGPWAIRVDPTGQYLYCTNRTGDTVSLFTITRSSGELTERTDAGSPFATGQGPKSMHILSFIE